MDYENFVLWGRFIAELLHAEHEDGGEPAPCLCVELHMTVNEFLGESLFKDLFQA